MRGFTRLFRDGVVIELAEAPSEDELARALARLGRGRLRQVRGHRDVAPALSEFFGS